MNGLARLVQEGLGAISSQAMCSSSAVANVTHRAILEALEKGDGPAAAAAALRRDIDEAAMMLAGCLSEPAERGS